MRIELNFGKMNKQEFGLGEGKKGKWINGFMGLTGDA